MVVIQQCDGSRDGRKTGRFRGEAVLSRTEVGKGKLAFAVGMRFLRQGLGPTQKSHGSAKNHSTLRVGEVSRQTGGGNCHWDTGKAPDHHSGADGSQKPSESGDFETAATHSTARWNPTQAYEFGLSQATTRRNR